MIDSIIIGCGPAGISTALYLHKLNHNVLLIGPEQSHLNKSDIIDNFYGQDRISGATLMKKGITQAINLGISYLNKIVLSIVKHDDYFIVKTNDNEYFTKSVAITTGKQRSSLKVKDFNTFKGKGIHMCATCDGFFYKHKNIAIIGAGTYMEQELSILENFTDDIIIFTNGIAYTHHKYKVITDPIKTFIGETRLTSIETKDNTYPIKGAFVAVGYPQATDLALKVGILLERNNILVNKEMQTNIVGIFAGGDCIGGKLQIAKAVYDGLNLSDGIHKYLKKR